MIFAAIRPDCSRRAQISAAVTGVDGNVGGVYYSMSRQDKSAQVAQVCSIARRERARLHVFLNLKIIWKQSTYPERNTVGYIRNKEKATAKE